MRHKSEHEVDIPTLIRSYRFTIVVMSVTIIFITLAFASALAYITFVKIPYVVQAAMADYFSDYEVIP